LNYDKDTDREDTLGFSVELDEGVDDDEDEIGYDTKKKLIEDIKF